MHTAYTPIDDMTSRRILLTVQSLQFGGMEKIVTELALGLKRRGHDVHVAGIYGGGPMEKPLNEGGVCVHPGIASRQMDWRAIPRLRSLCRNDGIQFAIAAMGGAMQAPFVTTVACRLRHVPCVRWLHTTPGAPLSRVGSITQRVMTFAGNHVVALTKAHAQRLSESWKIPAKQISVIWNGQQLPEQRTDETCRTVRNEFGLEPEHFVVGLVATFRPVKRHQIAIQAMRAVVDRLPQARLLLVGDGETRGAAEQTVKDLDLNRHVIFAGARHDAIRLYAAMDTHILCSYPAETFPLCVTEAMAAGVVPVATRVGGLPELVAEGQTGLLVEPESPTAIAQAVMDLAEQPQRRATMARTAHDYAHQHFSLDAMVNSFESLMDAQLDSGK